MARGLGIILVTLGHSEPIKDTFPQIWHFIYSFHMPLFFFISGFLGASAWTSGSIWGEYKRLFNRRFYIVVPYVMISLTYTVIKIGLPNLAKRQIIWESVVANIFLYPGMNPALFLWFLYVIILIWFVAPILSRLNQYVLFSLLLLCQVVPIDIDCFGTGLVLHNIIYFYLGLKSSQMSERFQLLLKARSFTIVSFLVFFLCYVIFKNSNVFVMRTFIAVLGTLWILSICFSLKDYLPVRWLEHCGRHSLQIYLLQYFFIFVVYFGLLKLHVHNGFIVLADFAVGLAGPMFVVKYVFPRSQVLGLLYGGTRVHGGPGGGLEKAWFRRRFQWIYG